MEYVSAFLLMRCIATCLCIVVYNNWDTTTDLHSCFKSDCFKFHYRLKFVDCFFNPIASLQSKISIICDSAVNVDKYLQVIKGVPVL